MLDSCIQKFLQSSSENNFVDIKPFWLSHLYSSWLNSVHKVKIAQSPRYTVVESPRDTVAQSPRDTVAQSPRDKVAQSPRDRVAQSPRDTVAQTPRDTVAQTPRDTKSKTPRPRHLFFLGIILSCSPTRCFRPHLFLRVRVGGPNVTAACPYPALRLDKLYATLIRCLVLWTVTKQILVFLFKGLYLLTGGSNVTRRNLLVIPFCTCWIRCDPAQTWLTVSSRAPALHSNCESSFLFALTLAKSCKDIES